MTEKEKIELQRGARFPLYINEDGTIGKKIADLGNGGYIKVNDARLVDTMIDINNKFNNECEEFHNKLMSLGVKAYRCNDGWVDRKRCVAIIDPSERTKGYYWFGKAEIGDKIFIGNSHDGGRMAEVLKVKEWVMDALAFYYKPLEEVIDGINSPFITKNNAPKYTFWDKINGKKKPYLKTDIYEMYPIPQHCCVMCKRYNSERNFCFKGCMVEDCFEPTDCEWYGENEEIKDEEILF